MTPNREPVAQAVNSITSALEIIAGMALDPETYDEVAEEEAALWRVKGHVEFILSYIRTKQQEKPSIRLVTK